MKASILVFFSLFLITFEGYAQTIFARANGDWDQTTVWSTVGTGGVSCGCVPVPGDDVLIDGYDVDIDAGTGDVTVNSVLITNVRGVDVRLRVQAGATLTVTNDFEIENNFAGSDAELTLMGTGSGLEILGDFLADQNDGDDLLIDIDDNGVVNIAGAADFFQDGGDDLELNLNLNTGTEAEWHVAGDLTFDHDGGDDIRVRTDDASSLLTVGGDLIVNMNTGLDDDISFNMDGGEMIVTGDALLTRADDYGPIDFDLDGGEFTCNDVVINSSGALFTLGAVRFFLDETSVFNCNSFSSTFLGADDFYIHLNQLAGSAAQFNVTNNMSLIRSSGDDIEILVAQDGEINIGGNFSLTSSGLDSEEMEIRLTNNGVMDVTGDCTLSIVDGEDMATNLYLLELAGAGANPFFHVGGNFSWTSTINLVDNDIEINGGELAVDGNLTITQNAGAEDFDFDIDDAGLVTVGGDLNINLNGGDDLSFNLGTNLVASAGACVVNGNCTLTHNANSGTSAFTHQVVENSRFTVNGQLALVTNFSASPGLTQDIRNTAEVRVDGDVLLTATAGGELEISLQNDAFFRIGGEFIRGASPFSFGALDAVDNATVEYWGSSAQIIEQDAGSGGDAFFYMNLEIDNSFGTSPQLTLEGDVTVHGDLTMNNGVVASDPANILIVADDGTTSNASNSSYVDGYMRKVGNDAFVFPSGNGGFYAPIGISAPTLATEQFEARYFLTMPHLAGFDSTMYDPSIHHISKVEYWKLNRTAGSSNPTVTLSWDTPRSGGVVNEADLRFLRWDGAIWRDLGSTALTGSAANGTLNNSVGIAAFNDANPYTLGTIDGINPLPVELVSFTGAAENEVVTLDWVTLSEVNCASFTLEKSRDAQNWISFAEVQGAGNSSVKKSYSHTDENPFGDVSYYRLKQTDFNGDYAYFGPISVQLNGAVFLYPNPANQQVNIVGCNDSKLINIYSVTGQLLDVELFTDQNSTFFSVESFPNGIYYVQVGNKTVERLVVAH